MTTQVQEVQSIAQAALSTAAALAPTLAASDPKVAAIVAIAPIAVQFLQSATALHQAGILTDAQLATMFSNIGSGVMATHSQWIAMNAADAARQA